jgi:uncharacterized protein Smg (DUF494 family)
MLYYILREILEGERDIYEDEDDIKNTLISEGYDELEINTAFGWLESYFQALSPELEPSKPATPPRGVRVLSFDERLTISPEAHGLLMNMESKGLIAPEITEEILNRSMNMFDDLIGLEEMRLVALLTIFEQGQHNLVDLIKLVDDQYLKSIH